MSSETLFAYGTLLVPEIIGELIGRVPDSVPATLHGYVRKLMRGQVYPGVTAAAGQSVTGLIYSGLSPRELEILDQYEGEAYAAQRLPVQLAAGSVMALVYVVRPAFRGGLSARAWNMDQFLERHLGDFQKTWR